MIFSSLTFFIFFLLYLIAHLLIPKQHRALLIVIASIIFYSWFKPLDIWIPFYLILVTYFGSIKLKKINSRFKKYFLFINLFFLFLPIIVFKYSSFFIRDFISPLINLNLSVPEFSIPLGISFITFTLTSFLIDICNNKNKSKVNFTDFAAYILFFPQLLAGPIVRARELLPQIENPIKAKITNLRISIFIFSIGLLKKIVFADYLSTVVDRVYDMNNLNFSGFENLLAIYSFSIQIYCDFSGYTDMAIGLGLILGIKLPYNFLTPYLSTSITEFWRNWHITLSTFLRDYIYIPLGGNKYGFFNQSKNILITMLIGGLWHGASWTFIIWGGLHAILLIMEKSEFFLWINNLPKYLRIFITFNFISFTWIFFRAQNLSEVFNIFNTVFVRGFFNVSEFLNGNYIYLLLIGIFFISHKFDNYKVYEKIIKKCKAEIFWPIIIFIFLITISFSQSSSDAFIYFDF